jgi:hypothetical protein
MVRISSSWPEITTPTTRTLSTQGQYITRFVLSSDSSHFDSRLTVRVEHQLEVWLTRTVKDEVVVILPPTSNYLISGINEALNLKFVGSHIVNALSYG